MTPKQTSSTRILAGLAVLGVLMGVAFSVFEAREGLSARWLQSPGLDFQLVTHAGQPFDEQALEGTYALVYFGYTHCPDVCPVGLFSLATVMRELESRGHKPAVVFVTLDPKRDTQAVMAGYVTAFHPRIVGLTGETAQIDSFADALGVKYEINGTGDDYLLSHTSLTYLLSPGGEVLRSFPDGGDTGYAVEVISKVMGAGK